MAMGRLFYEIGADTSKLSEAVLGAMDSAEDAGLKVEAAGRRFIDSMQGALNPTIELENKIKLLQAAGFSASDVVTVMGDKIVAAGDAAANPYSLSIAQKGSNVEVTLASASGEYACAFTPVVDSTGFTTFGKGGYFTCSHDFPLRDFRCADGTLHNLFSWGQDISGRVSGTEISGAWDAVWDDFGTGFGVETKAQLTGSR